MKKYYWFITPLAAFVFAIVALSSCQNASTDVEQPPPTAYAPPMVQPLKLSQPIKINWDSIKAVPVHPLVKPFDLDKLPAQSYDTAGFKPFKYPVKEAKLDINALPEKDLDIDKLPSAPIKFKTTLLPPPKLIGSGLPHLKDPNKFLYELGEAQGLQAQVVTGLFIDDNSFLWIATVKGLYRYDGENLLLYMPVTTPHLIFGMAQDTYGRIWLNTFNKGDLEVLDPKNGTLKIAEKSAGLSGTNLGKVFKDGQQRIWVPTASSKGAGIVDPKTQTVKWLDKAHGLPESTGGFIQDNSHNTWFASGKELGMIDPSGKKIKYLTSANGFKTDSICNMIFDRKGRLWIGYLNGMLNILNFKRNTVQTIKETQRPGTFILSLLEDNRGRMWVATAGTAKSGLEIIDPENRTARNLKKIDGLNSDFCFNVTMDNQQQVWIGTNGGLNMISDNNTVIERIGKAQVNFLVTDAEGLAWDEIVNNGIDIIDRKNKTIRHLGALQGLSNDTIGMVNEIDGKIFIPTNDGLNIIDPRGKTITYIGEQQGLKGRLQQTMVRDRAGRIWLCEKAGLCVYDPKAGTVKHIGKAQGVKEGDFDIIEIDPKGRIWYQSNTGTVGFIDSDTYTFQSITNNVPAFREVQGGGIFLADKKGNMWIGTNKGIYIADMSNKTLTTFSTPQGLIGERVATLLQRGNKIYASTTRGITTITPPEEGIVTNKKWGIESFGDEYGLTLTSPSYGLTDAISSDGDFLSGDYGVTVLDLSKRDTFLPPAFITGINVMDQPKIFKGRAHTVSNGITWDGVNGPYNLPENLQLPYNQNYVRFEYGTLNLAARDTTWYRYQLAGVDKNWSAETTATSSRNYFNVAPGKYTFEVISKSSDNGWSKPAVFSFTITPPWWQTWWAYILYVVLFAGIIWGFVTYRSMQLVKEKRVLEHKVQVRTEEVIQQKEEIEAQRDNLEKSFKELKNAQTQLIQSEKMASLGELTAGIAHEIQNPLNFVNNFSEVNTELIDELNQEIDKGNYDEVKSIAGDIKENQLKISQHGKRADFIVKGMLLHSRNNSGERQLTNINVLADEFFKLSYHGLRAKDKNFNAEMTTRFAENLAAITVVQQDIGRVLLNLLNNAFYATNQKAKTAGGAYKPEVTVSTAFEDGQVIIKVKDNGVGIPDAIKEKIMQPFFTTKPTGEGTGLGLSLTYDMVVKGHNGSIKVESKEGEGSEFVISLPA